MLFLHNLFDLWPSAIIQLSSSYADLNQHFPLFFGFIIFMCIYLTKQQQCAEWNCYSGQ